MNNFEHRIKNRLEHYNSEIEPYEIWDGIQEKRNKKKKRRWGIIWLAASVLILISTVALLYINSDNNKSQIAKNTNSSYPSDKGINSDNSNKTKHQSLSPNDKNTTNSTTSKNVSTKNIPENTITSNSTGKNNSIRKNKRKLIRTQINFNRRTTDLAERDNNTNTLKHGYDTDISTGRTSKTSRKLFSSFIPAEIKSILYSRQDLTLNITPAENKKTKKLFFDKKPYPEMSLAANYIHNSYTLTDNNSAAFLHNVKNNEKQLEAFDLYFSYNVPVYKKFGIATGLNYGQIDSKLDFTYREIKEVELDSALTKIVYKNLGDTLRIYERARTTGEFETHEIKYNYRRYLRIPVLITFSSKVNSLYYDIRTGVDFNILTCDNAKAITRTGKIVALKNTSKNQRKGSILGDFHFDLRLNYDLTRHIVLTFGPQYKLSLSSLMQKDAGFRQYRHSIGLSLGAKYKI